MKIENLPSKSNAFLVGDEQPALTPPELSQIDVHESEAVVGGIGILLGDRPDAYPIIHQCAVGHRRCTRRPRVNEILCGIFN